MRTTNTNRTAPLTAPGKAGMLAVLISHGLDEEKVRKILFDHSFLLQSPHAKIRNLAYKKYRDKLTNAKRHLSALLTNEALDNRYYDPTWAERENVKNKLDTLYPKKTKRIKQATGKLVVRLFDTIHPVIERINKKAGRKRYGKIDVHRLIAGLWEAAHDQKFTDQEIKKLYENNSKKPLKK